MTGPAAAGPEVAGPTAADSARGPALARPPERSRIWAQVRQFHELFQLPVRDRATAAVGSGQVTLRLALIEEELAELRTAARAEDLVGVADALADIVYVAYGTAHVYGIDLDAVLDEVHESNLTKLGSDGAPMYRADGKVIKGPRSRPPAVAAVLDRPAPLP